MDKFKNLNLPNCALCSLPFSTSGFAPFRNIKLPLLLHCGHSTCEGCLSLEVQSKRDVICKICNQVSTLKEDSNELAKVFPVNHYLAGLWHLKIITSNSELDSAIGFSKPKLKKKKISKSIICSECSETPADYNCKQCELPYCAQCFKLAHSYGKVFRSHVKVSLLEPYLNLDADKLVVCLIHSKYKLEYYCTPCRKPICAHCMVESHNRHAVDMIEKVDIDYEEDFIQSYLKVSNMLSRMKASKKKAENIVYHDKDVCEINKTEEEIVKYFISLHGKLSLIENQLLQKLSSIQTRNPLEEIIKEISNYIEDAETILASTRTLLNDQSNIGPNCLAVIENLRCRERFPSYFIELKDWEEPRFIADKNIVKALETHCSLEITNTPRYKLVTEDNLPPDAEIEPFKELMREDVIRLMKEPIPSSESSSACDSERPSSPSLASEKSYSSSTRDRQSEILFYPDEVAKGCSVSVVISHLISPSHFYVQREHAQKKLLDFQASLRPLQVHRSKPPTHPEKGKIYLSLYAPDSKWYRARIVNVIDAQTYGVFYIDFGNSEVVDRSRLRSIPRKSLNIPFLALRCQLSNCVPRFGEEWDPRAVSLMTEIIDNDIVTITVVEKTPLSYIVELFKVTENSFINLREALNFHELASMTKIFNQTVDICVTLNVTAPPQHVYSQGDILEVHVSHVNSPHEFYVQDFTFSRKLIQLSDDLQRAYSIRNLQRNSIYDPKKGMLIGARYSKDSKWYRAIILECLEGRRVQVFFIDFGNKEIVTWENIKLLSQRFGNLPPQAVKCGLSDVFPLKDEEFWDTEVCSKLHELIFDKKLKIVVENVANGSLNVVLYKATKECDICINASIVNEGLAISTGINSTVAVFPKVSKIPEDDFIQCELGVDKRKVKKKIMKPTKPEDEIVLSEHFVTVPEGTTRTKVFFKKIIDPGEFYIMPSCYEKKLNRMKSSIQNFYGEKKMVNEKKWNIDEKCVVNCDGIWYRATITEQLPDDQFKVRLLDEGCEKVVDSKQIDDLDVSFTSMPEGTLKCHLAGLEPALCAWSASSISELEEFVNNRKDCLYICQLGEIKEESLPVELFSRRPIETGPTEPNMDDWKSFNHYLRFIGQAKADGTITWDIDGQILNMNQHNDDNATFVETIKNSLIFFDNLYDQVETNEVFVEGEIKHNPQVSGPIVTVDAWLPAERLTNLEFIAAPTYVDEDCTVYVHDVEKSAHLLEEISIALCTKYDNSLPHPHDATLEPGDICIAKYHLDNKWYRAVVLEKWLDLNEYKIQFVDYGNIEDCKLSELRKVPVAQHIPIQSHKCCFHNLVPATGKWIERHVESVQYDIVDNNFIINLTELPGSDVYGINALLQPDGRDYITEMIELGYAEYKKPDGLQEAWLEKSELDKIDCSLENLSLISESKTVEADDLQMTQPPVAVATSSSTKKKPSLMHWSTILETLSTKDMPKLRYRNFDIPPVVKTIIVDVSAFLSPTQLILHIEDVEEDPVVLQMLEDFKSLSKVMQIEAPKQPILSPPYEYKACCAMFSADMQWYRGFVLEELAGDELLVQYVDYGNVEIIPSQCVHEIKEEWSHLEVQAVYCSLFNVRIGESCNMTEVLQLLQDCLGQGSVKAEIMERYTDLQVKLYIDDKLAYQNLIDLKLLNYIDR